MDDIPEIINSPCCLFRRAYVKHRDRMVLVRVGNTARALYGWRFRLSAFPPDWHLYVAEEDLTKDQIAEMKARQGPTLTLLEILGQITRG